MECKRCLMDDSIEGVQLTATQCNICDAHDAHEAAPRDAHALVASLRQPAREFDALLGVSGGLDSSYLAWWAHSVGLRLLLVHFDNGFNSDAADRNIARLVEYTKFPLVLFRVPSVYYSMCRKLLMSGTPDVDIANDLGMAKLSLDVARQYGITTILNGHNYRTEGWNPIGWTYMDGRYMRSLCAPLHVPSYLNLGALEQFTAGVRHVRPYYQLPPLRYVAMRALLSQAFGWEDYGAKHGENIYTEWVGARYLPLKFGIDKRRNYLSADIRSGERTKAQAQRVLALPPQFEMSKLRVVQDVFGETFDEWAFACSMPRDRSMYASYRSMFRAMRPLLWLAMQARLVPESFYRKYTR